MNTTEIPIQTGPVYRCFVCGAEPATFLTSFLPCNSPLDAWSMYIWYLKMPCQCAAASRVVRLGDCIAPLPVLSPRGLTPADIPAIRAALAAIAGAVSPDKRQLDPVMKIVYALLSGSVTPHQAIARLHEMAYPTTPASISLDTLPRRLPSDLQTTTELPLSLRQGAHP